MSFSAEMKDFLNAYQTGQKVNASRTDQEYKASLTDAQKKETEQKYSPEQLEYEGKMQNLKLQSAQRGLRTGSLRDQELQARIDAYKRLGQPQPDPFDPRTVQPPGTPGGMTGPVAPGTPAPSVVPANPILTPQKNLDSGSSDTVVSQAAGGLVPSQPIRAYQQGGAVPTDNEAAETTPDDEEEEQQGVLPTSASLPPNVANAQAAQRNRGIDGVISPELLRQAVLAGKTYGANQYGLHRTGALETPSTRALREAYAQGHGGIGVDALNAARDAVDPKHEMTDSQRNMAALGSVYQFWANKGESDKSARIAHQMLQTMKGVSERYAAIAAHAAAGGNASLAAQAAMKAYQNVPDGKDMSIEPNPDGGYMVHLTGPKGEDIVQTVATPQQLGAAAMGLAHGGFDKALLTAAGEAEQQAKPGKPPPAPKPSDRIAMEKLVQPHVDAFVDALNKKSTEKGKTPEEKAPVSDQDKAEMGNIAQRLMFADKNLQPNEAAEAAWHMMQPHYADPRNPEAKNYKLIPGKEGEPPTVDIGGKLRIQIPPELEDTIANSRAARIREVDRKEAAMADELDKNEPSMGQKAKGVGAAIGRAINRPDAGDTDIRSVMRRRAAQSSGPAIPSEPLPVPGAPASILAQRGVVLAPNTGAIPIERAAIPYDPNDRPL